MGFSRQEYWSGLPLPSPLSVLRNNLIPLTAKDFLGSSVNLNSFFSVALQLIISFDFYILVLKFEILILSNAV